MVSYGMVPPNNHTSRLINHYSCHLGQLIHRIQNPVTINLILIVYCFQKKNQTITVTESVPFQSSISWNNKKAFPVICSGFVWGCKLCLYDPPQIICDSLTQPVYNGSKAKFRLKEFFEREIREFWGRNLSSGNRVISFECMSTLNSNCICLHCGFAIQMCTLNKYKRVQIQ